MSCSDRLCHRLWLLKCILDRLVILNHLRLHYLCLLIQVWLKMLLTKLILGFSLIKLVWLELSTWPNLVWLIQLWLHLVLRRYNGIILIIYFLLISFILISFLLHLLKLFECLLVNLDLLSSINWHHILGLCLACILHLRESFNLLLVLLTFSFFLFNFFLVPSLTASTHHLLDWLNHSTSFVIRIIHEHHTFTSFSFFLLFRFMRRSKRYRCIWLDLASIILPNNFTMKSS